MKIFYNYFLRFDSKEKAQEMLEGAGIVDGYAHGTYVDHIGPLELESPKLNNFGDIIQNGKYDHRHHVNLRIEKPFTQAQIFWMGDNLINPSNPKRNWC